MNWLQKKARSDIVRVERNLRRWDAMRKKVHDLGYFVISSNSGGYHYLQEILKDKLIRGCSKLHTKLTEALIGENNQKIALDSPARFQKVMREAEEIIAIEINKAKRELKELGAVNGQFVGKD